MTIIYLYLPYEQDPDGAADVATKNTQHPSNIDLSPYWPS
jgi:hypothetical protein